MEQDTEIPDVSHASYPDPEDVGSNRHPYPVHKSENGLPWNGEVEERPDSLPSTTPQIENQADVPKSSSIPASNEKSGFATRSEYHALGERALFNLSQLARSNGPTRHWDRPQPPAVGGDNLEQLSPSTEGSNNSSSPAPSRPFSLPGYHYLPDIPSATTSDPPRQQPFGSLLTPPPSYAANAPLSTSLPAPAPAPPPRDSIRGRPRGRARGNGRSGWRQALKGTEHEALFKAPRISYAATGRRPRGTGKRARGRVRANADPGKEYRMLAGQATAAYLENDLEKARELCAAAIQVNPEVWSSYALLYEICQREGNEYEALNVLIAGAPVRRDPDHWIEVAERLLSQKGEAQTAEDQEFALKCYEEALKLNNMHFAARRARMVLYMKSKAWNKARKECGTLLTIRPGDLSLVKNYAELCAMGSFTEDLRGAVEVYERAFQAYAHKEGLGDNPVEQWDHLNVYSELLVKVGPPNKGAYQLKRIARWFLGRGSERFWNEVWADDREFDDTNERRMFVPQFQAGQASQDATLYGTGLPLELKVKLGLFRLQMGPLCHTEAFRHFEALRHMTDVEEITEYKDVLLEVANNLRERCMYGAAVEYYDKLKPISNDLNSDYWMSYAQCCCEVSRNAEAEAAYKRLVDKDMYEVQARINLIRLYEATSQSTKTLALVKDIISIGRSETLRRQGMSTYITACHRFMRREEKKLGAAAQMHVEDENYGDGTPNGTTVGGKARRSRKKPKARKLSDESVPSDVPERPVRIRAPPRRLMPTPRSPDPVDDASRGDESEEEAQESGANDEDNALRLQSGPVQEPSFTRGAGYQKSLSEQSARIAFNKGKLDELWPLVEANDDQNAVEQWVQHAAAMAKEFKLIKEFYPIRSREKLYTGLRVGGDASGRNMVAEMEAIKRKLVESGTVRADDAELSSTTSDSTFQDITFAQWHRIFANLALLHAERAQQDECYSVLRKVLLPANVFQQDAELKTATLSLSLSCAIMFNDQAFVWDVLKRLQQCYDDEATSQVYAGTGRLATINSGFYQRKTSNWLGGMVDEHDYLAMQPEDREFCNWGKAGEQLAEKAKQAGDTAGQLQAGLLGTYAQAAAGTQSSSPGAALPYLFRALAIEPDNLVINLCVATAYAMHAARRVNVKQHDIAHAIAFFYRYYDQRIDSEKAIHRQEAEYNLARLWHLIRMPHLAMPSYEKVLGMHDEVAKEGSGSGYEQEAAFALQSLHAAAGDEDASRAIGEEWLVV